MSRVPGEPVLAPVQVTMEVYGVHRVKGINVILTVKNLHFDKQFPRGSEVGAGVIFRTRRREKSDNRRFGRRKHNRKVTASNLTIVPEHEITQESNSPLVISTEPHFLQPRRGSTQPAHTVDGAGTGTPLLKS